MAAVFSLFAAVSWASPAMAGIGGGGGGGAADTVGAIGGLISGSGMSPGGSINVAPVASLATNTRTVVVTMLVVVVLGLTILVAAGGGDWTTAISKYGGVVGGSAIGLWLASNISGWFGAGGILP
jgi:hypothetical protein